MVDSLLCHLPIQIFLRMGTEGLYCVTKGLLYFMKWYFEKRNKMKSVLCEMEICTLRIGRLYFAKWKIALCEMENCTLQNENLYFAKWKSVLCEMRLLLSNFMKNFCEEASANKLFYYNRDRDTHISVVEAEEDEFLILR